MDVHGIVPNGQVWVFYKLTTHREVFVSGLFTTDELPKTFRTPHKQTRNQARPAYVT